MIEGAIIALVGVVVGRFLPGRRQGVKHAGAPEAVCGCEHHYALHDPKIGKCFGFRKNPAYEEHLNTSATNPTHIQCVCRQYTGPEPVEQFFATPMLPPKE